MTKLPPLLFVLAMLFGIVALFGIAFALKMVYLEAVGRHQSPGGFEVNLTDQNSVTAKKENDHG